MKRRQLIQTSFAAAMAAALPSGAAAMLKSMSAVEGDLAAVTGDGGEVILQAGDVKALGESLRGNLLLPGNAGYEQARRVLNMSIDRHPALVVQPSGVADISSAVNFARERELLVAVKCGGHSWSGKSTCEGGMQIDLSHFRHARLDPAARRLHVAGGSLLGEMDHEAMSQGMVTTAGTVSHTGVGGLTLSGGFGRVARRFGLALDNVRSVDIVTADGQWRHASADENPELYWGVRGGGGNFGVVTNFEFAVHPMQREVVAGSLMFPISQARQILQFYSEYIQEAPDELYVDFVMVTTPDAGDGLVVLLPCYSGPQEDAERVLAPLRKAGKPVADTIAKADYVAVQSSQDNTEARVMGEYVKSGFISQFPSSLVDSYVDMIPAAQRLGIFSFFQHAGGAINRVPEDGTAFAFRDTLAMMAIVTSWPMEEGGEAQQRKLKEMWAGLAPYTSGWYTVEVSDESNEAINRNYRGNYERLVSVKNQYDPGNLFRLNANIQPTV
jgi:hypothetical protein